MLVIVAIPVYELKCVKRSNGGFRVTFVITNPVCAVKKLVIALLFTAASVKRLLEFTAKSSSFVAGCTGLFIF